MSTQPILHQYPASPFSEKVRLAFGLKGLAYRSVRIPAVMPKPDLVPLTGGYRRTPVLQIGAHVYCDTTLILQVLEGLKPSPSLYAHPAAEVLAQWADGPLFDVAVALASRPTKLDTILELMLPVELEKIADDRKAMRVGGTRVPLKYATAHLQLGTYLARIDGMLAPGPFLLGDRPGAADLAVYHCLWFIEMLSPQQLPKEGPVAMWMERIRAIGHGTPVETSSEQAIEVCRQGGPAGPAPAAHAHIEGVELGARVTVCADDWGRDEVTGTLLESGPCELVLRREDDRAGSVAVHFPRLGYEVRAVGS